MKNLLELDHNTLCFILVLLSNRDLVTLRTVCKYFKNKMDQNLIWKLKAEIFKEEIEQDDFNLLQNYHFFYTQKIYKLNLRKKELGMELEFHKAFEDIIKQHCPEWRLQTRFDSTEIEHEAIINLRNVYIAKFEEQLLNYKVPSQTNYDLKTLELYHFLILRARLIENAINELTDVYYYLCLNGDNKLGFSLAKFYCLERDNDKRVFWGLIGRKLNYSRVIQVLEILIDRKYELEQCETMLEDLATRTLYEDYSCYEIEKEINTDSSDDESILSLSENSDFEYESEEENEEFRMKC